MEQQSQINYRFILKRVLAYMIDIIVVTIIATLLSNVKFINNNTKEYQEMYQEFNELYKDYTNINVLINDAIKDDKITADRVKMAADIGICSNTITNNLKKLKELKLIDGEKGSFVINPQIFWKGDKSVRDSLLKTEEFKIKFSIEP